MRIVGVYSFKQGREVLEAGFAAELRKILADIDIPVLILGITI